VTIIILVILFIPVYLTGMFIIVDQYWRLTIILTIGKPTTILILFWWWPVFIHCCIHSGKTDTFYRPVTDSILMSFDSWWPLCDVFIDGIVTDILYYCWADSGGVYYSSILYSLANTMCRRNYGLQYSVFILMYCMMILCNRGNDCVMTEHVFTKKMTIDERVRELEKRGEEEGKPVALTLLTNTVEIWYIIQCNIQPTINIIIIVNDILKKTLL